MYLCDVAALTWPSLRASENACTASRPSDAASRLARLEHWPAALNMDSATSVPAQVPCTPGRSSNSPQPMAVTAAMVGTPQDTEGTHDEARGVMSSLSKIGRDRGCASAANPAPVWSPRCSEGPAASAVVRLRGRMGGVGVLMELRACEVWATEQDAAPES